MCQFQTPKYVFKMFIWAAFGRKFIIKLNENPLKAFVKSSSPLLVHPHKTRLQYWLPEKKPVVQKTVSKDQRSILAILRVRDVNSEGRYNIWT